jgi:outer membrane beta-barrel protein
MSRKIQGIVFAVVAFGLVAGSQAQAAPPAAPAQPAAPATAQGAAKSREGERVSVDALRQKYWENVEEGDLRVVQNRIYTKAGKIEPGFFIGTIATDPFLSVKNWGFNLGIHINEEWAVNGLYWRDAVSQSSAQSQLRKDQGIEANTNPPRTFMGGEVVWSPIYGKLSLLGQAIIHYDLHMNAGAGVRDTASGRTTGLLFGIGQQVYLSKFAALKLDYRFLTFQEDLVIKAGSTPPAGMSVGDRIRRTNNSDVITLGVSFFIPVF